MRTQKSKEEKNLWTNEVERIEIPKNRTHELYPIYRSLQEIYNKCPEALEAIEKDLTKGVLKDFGRKGMTAWRVLCLIAVRYTKMDYEMLAYNACHDELLRQILEVTELEKFMPTPQCIQNNISKISQETIEKIFETTIKIARDENFEDGEIVRGDTFVCETDIHHPIDNRQLYDCGKKLLEEYEKASIPTMRKSDNLMRELKKANLAIGKIRHSKKNTEKKEQGAYNELIERVKYIMAKGLKVEEIKQDYESVMQKKKEIKNVKSEYAQIILLLILAVQLIDLIDRRIFKKETIPVNEKILSIYEPHTQLINRGKYPLPIEYGHNIFVGQGKSGIVIDYRVFEIEEIENKKITEIIKDNLKRFGKDKFKAWSLDKGYYFKDCHNDLKKYMDMVVIGKKGYLNDKDKKRESNKKFKKLRHWRSGIESLISALMRGNGLDLCLEKGYERYKKYVGFCVISRNLQTLGNLLLRADAKKAEKKIA